jgi:hypothetical protein
MVMKISNLIEEAQEEVLTSPACSANSAEMHITDYMLRRAVASTISWIMPTNKNFYLVMKAVEDCSFVFDAGCGSGIFGKYILNSGKKYLGTRLKKYDCDNHSFIDEKYITNPCPIPKDADGVLLIWPPYNNDMAINVLDEFISGDAKTLVYVGEGRYGCNANMDFFELMDKLKKDNMFEIVHNDIDRYSGMSDFMWTISKRA